MKKQIFVVEGKNDVAKLKQVFENINVVSVGGSAINDEVITYLKSIENDFEIVLCLDPDYMGLKIRKELEEVFTNASHIFLDRKKSFSNNRKKIGLEHLSEEDLKLAFNNIYKKESITIKFTMSDLYQLGLIGKKNSKAKRDKVSLKLNLGYVNGKTLLNRLNRSKYTLIDIENAINS